MWSIDEVCLCLKGRFEVRTLAKRNIIDQTKDLFIQGGREEENMYQGT